MAQPTTPTEARSDALRRYTRWTRAEDAALTADILCGPGVHAHPVTGLVWLDGTSMSPDEARLIGVRLIEAAALADGDRAIRDLS